MECVLARLSVGRNNSINLNIWETDGVTKDIWQKLLSPYRVGLESLEPTGLDRSAFAKDIDRIIFSNAFRRLGKKTQVHPLSANDHIHTRLSHSLEVSSVGRSLGTLAGQFLKSSKRLPDWVVPENLGEIVQAACLAHDIGNPPFGHAGESAIRSWFLDPDNHKYVDQLKAHEASDFMAFDGNAQGFRVVSVLEHHTYEGGMRLTYPTLASMIKYPVSSYCARGSGTNKFSFYSSEREAYYEISDKLGLRFKDIIKRHPLSYLSEAADDICYLIIDLEDARELKLIGLDNILSIVKPMYEKMNFKGFASREHHSERRKTGYLRALLINALVQATASAFATNIDKIMSGEVAGNIVSCCDDNVTGYMEEARNIAKGKIYNDPRKVSLEIGSYSLYKILLDVLIPAVHDYVTCKKLSYKSERAITLLGNSSPSKNDELYTAYLRVIDFVSGMTDNYATFISEQFSGTGH